MPYIVTTTVPSNVYDANGLKQANVPHGVARRAVATLDEAREAATDACIASEARTAGEDRWDARFASFERECETLPESGGTVGPLPDGTVIEVQRKSWDELRDLSRLPYSKSGRHLPEILDAYNAS